MEIRYWNEARLNSNGMAVYLIAGFLLAELSFGKCLRRLRVVLLFVCMVGLNMDYSGTIQVGEYPVSKQYLPQLLFMVYQEIFCRYLTRQTIECTLCEHSIVMNKRPFTII